MLHILIQNSYGVKLQVTQPRFYHRQNLIDTSYSIIACNQALIINPAH